MNKKGFTLIEIIVCIVIIVLIGTLSVMGINVVMKNIKINKLKDIEDEIMIAAKIYLETNSTVQTQLYNNGNAVVVPLNVLVNEGLLDLTYTDLKKDDIEDEYVITALSGKTRDDNCVDITTNGSWNLSKDAALYICTDTTTGSSNLAIINPESMNNSNKAKQEPYIYKGENPNNYVMYNGNGRYRIYYIDTDDSIILVNKESFGNVFNGKTDDICGVPAATTMEEMKSALTSFSSSSVNATKQTYTYYINICNGITTNTSGSYLYADFNNVCYEFRNISAEYYERFFQNKNSVEQENMFNLNSDCNYGDDNKEKYIGISDYFNTFIPYFNGFSLYKVDGIAYNSGTLRTENSYLSDYFIINNIKSGVGVAYDTDFGGISVGRKMVPYFEGYKLRLKSCMKIKSGTGAYQEPYILDDSSC